MPTPEQQQKIYELAQKRYASGASTKVTAAPPPLAPTPAPAPTATMQPKQTTSAPVQQAAPPMPVPRNEPTVATTQNPLISKGQMPPAIQQTAAPKTDSQMLEDIAMKQYKGESLSDDEVRFQIKQQLAKSQPVSMIDSYTQKGIAETGDPQFDHYATPEEELQQTIKEQQKAFDAQKAEQLDQIDQTYNQVGGIYDKKIADANAQIDTKSQEYATENDRLLAERKAAIEAEKAKAIGSAQEQGRQRAESTKDIQSFSGFGRSTKTMELLDKVGKDTQDVVANIEREAKRQLDDYQVELVAKTDSKLQELRDRVSKTQDEKDMLEVKKTEQKMGLITDLMKQNPSSPQNMIATAEKLQTARLKEMELSQKEHEDMQKSARENFTFMVSNFGTSFLQNMDSESLSIMAENVGMNPKVLQKMGPTLKEVDTAYNRAYQDRDFQYKVNNDKATRDFTMMMGDRNYQNELQKMGVGFGYDVQKLYLGQQFKDAEDAKKFGNISYGNYAASANNADGSALYFEQPIPGPGGKPVIAINPKLADAYPNGYKKEPQSGANGLGGQCAYEVQQLTTLPKLGNTLTEKISSLRREMAAGKAFLPGQKDAQIGNSILTNESKENGHIAMIVAKAANGNYILGEFNRNGPLTYTNTREISPTDKRILGIFDSQAKPQYKVVDTMEKIKSVPFFGNKLNDMLTGVINANMSPEAQAQTQAKYQEQLAAQNGGQPIPVEGPAMPPQEQLTPDREAVRSGKMPEFVMKDMYEQLKEAVNRGKLPKEALNQFLQDYQEGQKASPSKTDFTQANQLYNRYDNITKEIRTLDQGFAITKNFDVNTKNPTDDQALIFSFMKTLDPGSVVREGEFAFAQKATSLFNQIAGQFGLQVKGTGLLLPEQRKKMLSTMQKLYQEKRGQYEPLLKQAAEVGTKFGVEPSAYLDYLPGQFGSESQGAGSPGAKAQIDIKGALNAGYSQQEVLAQIQQKGVFDVQGAINAGYSPEEILNMFNS